MPGRVATGTTWLLGGAEMTESSKVSRKGTRPPLKRGKGHCLRERNYWHRIMRPGRVNKDRMPRHKCNKLFRRRIEVGIWSGELKVRGRTMPNNCRPHLAKADWIREDYQITKPYAQWTSKSWACPCLTSHSPTNKWPPSTATRTEAAWYLFRTMQRPCNSCTGDNKTAQPKCSTPNFRQTTHY